MLTGTGSSKLSSDDVLGGSDVSPKPEVPLSAPATIDVTAVEIVMIVDGTNTKDGGTQSKGPRDDAV